MIKYIVLVLFLTALSTITAALLSGKQMHTCHGEHGESCDSCIGKSTGNCSDGNNKKDE